MNIISHTHTTTRKKYGQRLKIFLTGCFLITLLIIMMAPVAIGKTGFPSVNETTEEGKTIVASSANLSMVTVEHNAEMFFSDHPGKPDDHRSNGDDLPVRPPR